MQSGIEGEIMFKNYLKISLRNLLRYKAFSFINISGLAIGLCCCIIIFLHVRSETGYDQYHKSSANFYRLTLDVERLSDKEIVAKSATSSILWPPAFKKDYPEIVDFCRIMEDNGRTIFRAGDNLFEEENVLFSDESVFRLFTWPLVAGNRMTALTKPFTMVISETMARKYFGDEEPLGQVLLSQDERTTESGEIQKIQYEFKITGVMKDIPFKSHVKPDFLISFITLNRFFDADVHAGVHPQNWYWRGTIVHNYLMLQDGFPPGELEAKFPAFLAKYIGDATITRGYQYHPYLQPISGIHLESSVDGTIEPSGDLDQLYLFSIIAFFILVIACINFMNLSTARSGTRSKEVGVRKVLGADRKRLVRQFMGESIILSFLALILALLLVEVLNPIFHTYIGREFYFDSNDSPLYILGIVSITLFVGFLAGSYPAFFLSGFRPACVLRGALASASKGAIFRKVLVVSQFAITVFFIIGTLTVYNQIRFMRRQDLGFKQSQVLVIPPETNRLALDQLGSFRNDFLTHSRIKGVTISSAIPGRVIRSDIWGEKGKSGEEGVSVNEFAVDYDFIKMYGLELITGRNFQQEMITDAVPAGLDTNGYEIAGIINEAAVKRFGWISAEDALGKQLIRDPAANDFRCRVVGVLKDFHFTSLHEAIEPAILFINPNYVANNRFLSLEIFPGDVSNTIEFVRNKFSAASPEAPFQFFFIDEDFGRLYEQDERMMEVYGYISVLTILVACLGLFGLASFSAEQRTKEVGIRKVLGASVTSLLSLLSKDFLKVVEVANIIAWPIAYYLMNKWLQGFAYRFELGPGTFLFSAFLALLIALLTVSYQAFKAALANPIAALRYE